jgi:hypothetical protein
MSVNKLTYNGHEYADEIVAGSGGLDMDHAMVGETLSVDTLTVPMITGDMPRRFLARNQGPNGFFKTGDGKIFCVRKGAPTPQFVENGPGLFYFGNDLVGRYYLKERKKTTGRNEHLLRFLSAIRLLDQSDHPGGMYSGVTVGDVADEIIGGVVAYTIDDDIAAITIDMGYLPYARRRANLQLLLMAYGAVVRNAADGTLRITQLSDTVTGVFDNSRVFMGGEVIDQVPYTAVQLTENNYLETTETVELYNDITIDTVPLVFKEPYHDLQITGGTIIDYSVNHCTFTGSGAVVLTGKKYLHVTRIVTSGTAPTGSASDVVKTVANNTMVGPTNAAAVADRIFEYLSVRQKIKQEVVVGTERPGDVVSVTNPDTGGLVTACLKPMNIAFGFTENRAACEFLVDYVPSGAVAGFEHYAVLTGTGTLRTTETHLQYKRTEDAEWTNLIALSEIAGPTGDIRIRSILVGAGNGGTGGDAGKHSVPGTSGNGADGGAGGEKGLGGLVFESNQTISPGTSIDYSCGVGGPGGPGGVPNYSNPGTGTAGEPGTATTFGALTSASGRQYPYGYTEPKSGLTVAGDGVDGIAGGRGNHALDTAPGVTFGGITYNPGANGTNQTMNGFLFRGGRGGGPAVGSNGRSGQNAGWTPPPGTSYPKHGDGGAGADAADGADGTNYGQGGSAGHGGGGGGAVAANLPGQPSPSYNGLTGPGGAGGDAGDGAEGVIIVYF